MPITDSSGVLVYQATWLCSGYLLEGDAKTNFYAQSGAHCAPRIKGTYYICALLQVYAAFNSKREHVSFASRRETENHTGYLSICGPGSSVGVATGYGLDGPGIESRWGEIFRPSRPTLGPTQ